MGGVAVAVAVAFEGVELRAGVWRSRCTMMRMPSGSSAGTVRRPLSSATAASSTSQTSPVVSMAAVHSGSGMQAMAARSRSVMAHPTENSLAHPCRRNLRIWARKALVHPAVSARISSGLPWR